MRAIAKYLQADPAELSPSAREQPERRCRVTLPAFSQSAKPRSIGPSKSPRSEIGAIGGDKVERR
jgi:hypothetical protein